MNNTVEYIESKGWQFKEQGKELILQDCPFCRDTRSHFYIRRDNGLYFCQKCQTKGNLSQLKKHHGDVDTTIRQAFQKPKYNRPARDMAEKHHAALLRSSETLAYLEGRKIMGESIERFKLGLCQKNGTGYLSIPHYRGEELINIKFRALPPAEKEFKRVTGCESILFNTDAVHGAREIFITEGELDAITLIQAGMENTVSGTTGAGSFDAAWIDQLKEISRIYICYDQDKNGDGQNGARNLAKRLGYDRCYNVVLPVNDVNDFFKDGHTLDDFNKVVSHACPFDLEGVISVDTALDLLRAEIEAGKDEQGLLTPWANVNRLVKGFSPGDLIIVSAPPKIGKTSWCLNIAQSLTFNEVPVLIYCLEMRPEKLTRKFLQAYHRRENLIREDIEGAKSTFAGLPLYFAYSFRKPKLEAVLTLIREAIKRYGLRLVVFDHLHFLVRSLGNVNEEVAQAVQGFKLLAQEMEIPIIVIAQPRKPDRGNRDAIIRADDILYSSAVHADCDQMIILHRKRIASKACDIDSDDFTAKVESYGPITLVRIEAHRYGPGGETLLYFHGEYSRFDLVEQESRPKVCGQAG